MERLDYDIRHGTAFRERYHPAAEEPRTSDLG